RVCVTLGVGFGVRGWRFRQILRLNMKQFATLALGAAAVFLSTTAMADPIMINDDEGYSRLARWEKHLDDRIADGVQSRSLSPRRAWQIQKDLDSIEARVLQSYYESNN